MMASTKNLQEARHERAMYSSKEPPWMLGVRTEKILFTKNAELTLTSGVTSSTKDFKRINRRNNKKRVIRPAIPQTIDKHTHYSQTHLEQQWYKEKTLNISDLKRRYYLFHIH